jgi:hypothetical protein
MPTDSLPVAAWISVLKLSTLWQMDRLQNVAVQNITSLQGQASEYHWITLFDLSTRHQLRTLRDVAIQELSRCLSAEMVLVLARKYQSKDLFLKGCWAFVQQPEEYGFNERELAKLDMTTVVKLFRCREKCYRDNDMDEESIRDEFEEFLDEMGAY